MQLYHQNTKTVYRASQGHFRQFDTLQNTQYSSYTSRLCTACATPEGIPSSTAPPPIPDTTATPDAIQVSAAAYYNKVYKRAAVRPVIDPCPLVHHSAGHARGGGSVHPACIRCRGQPSGRGVAGGAEPLTAIAVSLFGLSPDS